MTGRFFTTEPPPGKKYANIYVYVYVHMGFPCGSSDKESTHSMGDLGSIPRSGRAPGEGNGNHSSILAWTIPWMEEPGRL